MKLEFKVEESTSKKGNTFKALYLYVDGVKNFVCFVK